MPEPDTRWSGWRGICFVAITFVYFLIFAQFAFLKRLAELGIAGTHLKSVMAAMAAGGILWSLLTPRLTIGSSPLIRLRTAFGACAASAFLSLLPLELWSAIAVSFLIGSAMGLLTVTLVSHLRLWLGQHDPLLRVGAGTGVGYFICNIPALFTASAQVQALTAGSLLLLGILCTFRQRTEPALETAVTPRNSLSFLRVLACFTALVWLDSAAFFIIQNTPDLKAGTWEGTIHLWVNGSLHFAAALASVLVLRHRGLLRVFSLAFSALAAACLLLLEPHRAALASVFYPVGVSLYSVALVAYPSLLAQAATEEERARLAGWIYAVAGWFGSAMGIGMGQNLGRVPPIFVLGAGAVIFSPALYQWFGRRKLEFTATVGILLAALCILGAINVMRPSTPSDSQIERGRQVYIAEGCINCHSQYVRPHSSDELMWGPVRTMEKLRQERPPLIGNRRQGPDLAEVGRRRSSLWLKAHLVNPAEVSYASFMPSYAYLFHDNRGDDLVAYTGSLKEDDNSGRLSVERSWSPSAEASAAADFNAGGVLLRKYCETCHGADGHTRQSWQKSFKRIPPDLNGGPFAHILQSDAPAQRKQRFAQIVKFGIPGTDMPGHEYLSDRQIASITRWLTQLTAQTAPEQRPINLIGEKK